MELRIKLNETKQRLLFEQLVKKFKSHKEAAKFLGVSKHAFYNYFHTRTRNIPLKVIEKIKSELKVTNIKISFPKTLKEIRQENIERTFIALEKKYGPAWGRVVTDIARKKLKEKYGDETKKILWEKSVKAFEEKFGKDWHKIISKLGMDALKRKYGEKWFDVTLKKGRDKLKEKYGENWQKHLSNLGMKSLEKKYGKDFQDKIIDLQKMFDGLALTETERLFTKLLKELRIPYKTHKVKEDVEFDVVIPDINSPKIICELSTVSPNTHAVRKKLIQILYQKRLFPNTLHICILKKIGITNSGSRTVFNPDILKFILDEGFILFWTEQIEEIPALIKQYLYGKTTIFDSQIQRLLREIKKEEKILLRNSKAGAIVQMAKVNRSEKMLNKILSNLKVNPMGAKVLKTKYGGYVAVDNFEKVGDVNIIYEITDAKHPSAIRSLAGKLAYISHSIDNLKSIAILTNVDKLTNRTHDTLINFAADAIILKNEFNEEGLRKARESILQS